MSDFPTTLDYSHHVITSIHPESVGNDLSSANTSLAGTLWVTANRAIYIPFRVGYPITIVKMFWINGTTVGTNHVDVGIYEQDGTRLVSSGSTLTAGASGNPQTVDTTDVTLNPGLYYMAMVMDGGTDSLHMTNAGTNVPIPQAVGIYEQATSFPLPSTATFATASMNVVPALGLTSNTVV